MGYSISYLRTPDAGVAYHWEAQYHLAWDAAHAIVQQGFLLGEIQCAEGSFSLTRAEILESERSRAANISLSGVDLYARENAQALKRFLDFHSANLG